ncbi:hypothetical protein [Corynebacterium sp. UMB10119B.1]|nr:hypothetical protein [Corynebacterium sp. UMB10119B]MDK8364314.1 hypothetical protein [Corynebacterium sp. UMB10119B]
MTDALAPKPEDLSIDAPSELRAQLTHRTNARTNRCRPPVGKAS